MLICMSYNPLEMLDYISINTESSSSPGCECECECGPGCVRVYTRVGVNVSRGVCASALGWVCPGYVCAGCVSVYPEVCV